MKPPLYITRAQALAYEVSSSWWAGMVSWKWAQDLAARYFAWKVKRKYNRYNNGPYADK